MIRRLREAGSTALSDRYGVEDLSDPPMAVLEAVARRRGGFLLKGGRPNINEAAKAVLKDWVDGKIGYYTLPGGVM